MLMRISVLLAAVLVLVQGCSPMPVREWPALEGRVLDAQTEEPIEGAFVVARWIGYGGHTQSQCFHVDVAQTDAQGRYRIEPWRNDQDTVYLVDQRQTVERVHKTGYRESPLTQEQRSYLRGIYYLEKDAREVGERLEHLSGLMKSSNCYDAGKSERALYGLRAAIYYEAKSLHAPGDLLQWMREMAASAWLAHDSSMSQHEHDEAVSDFLKGNLQ